MLNEIKTIKIRLDLQETVIPTPKNYNELKQKYCKFFFPDGEESINSLNFQYYDEDDDKIIIENNDDYEKFLLSVSKMEAINCIETEKFSNDLMKISKVFSQSDLEKNDKKADEEIMKLYKEIAELKNENEKKYKKLKKNIKKNMN